MAASMSDAYLDRGRDLWSVAAGVSDTYFHRERDLWHPEYLSDTLPATGVYLCGGMCQIHCLPQVYVFMEVCVRYSGCHRSLFLWRYVSDTLAATYHRPLSLWKYVSDMLTASGLCLYGGMCQLRCLPQATGLCLYGSMCQIRWVPTETVSNSKAGCRQFHKLYKCILSW